MAEKKLQMRFDIPGAVEVKCNVFNSRGLNFIVKNDAVLKMRVFNGLGLDISASNATRG